MEEYVVMAKLTNYINKRPITEFQSKWRAFFPLIIDKAVDVTVDVN